MPIFVSPDGLSAAAITAGLGTRFVGQRVIHRATVESTMDIAAAEARAGCPEGLVVVADLQTTGRGRFQRRWLSNPGEGVHLSMVLRPTPDRYTALNMAASLAIVETARQVGGLEASIKWPNDVHVNGRKIAGILIESASQGNTRYVILGVGINVSLRARDYPELAGTATSLVEAAGRPITRLATLRPFLELFEQRYEESDTRSLVAAWRSKLNTLGRHVRVTWQTSSSAPASFIDGVATDVTETGALLVRQADGTTLEAVAGEVTLQE